MDRTIKSVAAVLIIILIVFFTYILVNRWHKKELDAAVKKERDEFHQQALKLEQRITGLEEEIASHKRKIVSEEKLEEVFGKIQDGDLAKESEDDCETLKKNISSFFLYLDTTDYIKANKPEQGTQYLFEEMAGKLSETIPMVTDETRDIVSLTHNMAHFYRTLGKKRIKLVKEIMKNEEDILESTMSVFFAYYVSGNCCKEEEQVCPSLEVLYEYAGFFLKTLAGKSYLMRRSPKLKILTIYYSILILDRANDAESNHNGIDIRPHIDLSLINIMNQKNLFFRKQYLKTLEGLKVKYQI